MTFLLALVLAFPDTFTARQGRSLDGGMAAWAVECTNCGVGGASGGLTNTDLRASPVPMYVMDAGVLNVGPVAISTAPALFIADAGVLNVNFPATQAVSAASLPLPSGAATGTLQGTGNTSLSSIDGKLPVLVSGKIPVDIGASIVSVTGGLTDTQLRATAVPVSLATAPTTPVTGTFFQSTQPVSAASLPLPSGAATDATLSQLLDGGVGLLSTIAASLTSGSERVQVTFIAQPLNPLLQRCNPVRRTNCQP